MRKTTKWKLVNAMLQGEEMPELGLLKVNGIELESGSGKTFNVSGYDYKGNKVSVFVTTID